MSEQREDGMWSIRLLPGGEVVEPRLHRAEAEGYLRAFNRTVDAQEGRAEMVAEERTRPNRRRPKGPRGRK